MPRRVRVEYAGAVYHVMCRGDRREEIFRTDEDRVMMLETLAQMCERTGFVIHAYVLMPNHYHLLLETPQPNLVAGMKWFQGTYTQRYNTRHCICGHLFQGRYKAVPVDGDDPSYFRIASDYIHLNPARAHMLEPRVPRLEAFCWSSFPSFVTQDRLPPWLQRKRVFSCLELPDDESGSRQRYAEYMARRVRDALAIETSAAQELEWKQVRRGWHAGGGTFGERVMEHTDRAAQTNKRASHTGEGMALYDARTAERCLDESLQKLGVSLAQIRSCRKNDPLKQAAAWWVKSRTGIGDEWICARLEMGNRVNVSRAVRAYRDLASPQHEQIRKKMSICTD